MSRPFEPRDDEAIVAMYARLAAPDPSIDAPDLERWRMFRALAVFDGGRLFRVVERAGAIVAFMTCGAFPRIGGGVVWRVRIFVDAPARGEGIAADLLRVCEADARAAGVAVLESFVDARWVAGRAFAESCGFSVFVHDLFLGRDASAFEAQAPDGVRLRPFVADADERAWASVFNAALRNDIGFTPETPESVATYARFPGFAVWLAEATEKAEASEVVGMCHVERRERLGLVQSLGVLPAWEGRGIGAALLARGLATLREGGVDRVELCTERQNLRAQRLYARAGFAIAREAFTYRKSISL